MEEFPTVNPTADTRKYGPRLATDRETNLHHRSIIDYHIRPIDVSTGYTVLTFGPICRHVESIGRSLPLLLCMEQPTRRMAFASELFRE